MSKTDETSIEENITDQQGSVPEETTPIAEVAPQSAEAEGAVIESEVSPIEAEAAQTPAEAESAVAPDERTPPETTYASPEEELQQSIDLMASSIAQTGSPNFKTFWDARTRALELFKGNLVPAVRAVHWVKYRELTKEARRLKDIFEEESAFAVEQIEMAIKALEKDLADTDIQLQKVPEPDFPKNCRTVQKNYAQYCRIQRELNLLNTHATRVNGLRKELIKTEIRIRQKNKFFQRLSATGDLVFPKRKELIKEISQLFTHDVDAFVSANFSGDELDRPVHAFREEIKDLQFVAKSLTLNTQAFTRTRKLLSTSWDKLKEADKERRKAQAEQQQGFKKNALAVQEKIEEFKTALQGGGLSTNEAQQQLDEIAKFMKTQELGRDEVSALRRELTGAEKPLKEQLKEEEKKRRQAMLKKEQARQEKIKALEEKIEALRAGVGAMELKALQKDFEAARQALKLLDLSGYEKESMQRQLLPVRDALAEKAEEELLKLPEDQKAALKQLQAVLKTKQERRAEIKDQIEKYRKASGSSGLDFEQSMYFHEQLSAEKERLDKIGQGITEVETKIAAARNPAKG